MAGGDSQVAYELSLLLQGGSGGQLNGLSSPTANSAAAAAGSNGFTASDLGRWSDQKIPASLKKPPAVPGANAGAQWGGKDQGNVWGSLGGAIGANGAAPYSLDVPARSGSAPPSVEGSIFAAGGFPGFSFPTNQLSFQADQLPGTTAAVSLSQAAKQGPSGAGATWAEAGGGGHGGGMGSDALVGGITTSEEQIRSDPAYLAYYYRNHHLNPRLPPPILTHANFHLAQRLQAAGLSRAGEGGGLSGADAWKSTGGAQQSVDSAVRMSSSAGGSSGNPMGDRAMAAGALRESLSSLRLTQRSPALPTHREEGGEAFEGEEGGRLQQDRPQQDRHDSSDAAFLSAGGLNGLRSRSARWVEDAISQKVAGEGGLGFEGNEVARSSSARGGEAAAMRALQSLQAHRSPWDPAGGAVTIGGEGGEEGAGMRMRRRSLVDLIQVREGGREGRREGEG